MQRVLCSLVLVGAVVLMGACATGEGRALQAASGAAVGLNTPVSFPYDGPAPAGRICVVEEKTGKKLPATLRGGELTFLSEATAPRVEYVCRVEAVEDKAPPRVEVRKQEAADVLEVRIHGEHFVSYNYGPDYRKPFLWPVYGEGQVAVTRNWPMGEMEDTKDHVHQKSLWSSYGDVNGVNTWNEGENDGTQRTVDVSWGSGDAYGWITSKNVWQDKDRNPVLTDEREYRFYATSPQGRMLDLTITVTATNGDVLFKDTKEGGMMALRIRDLIRENPRGGVITNAEGKKGEKECWGKPSPWCDYSGAIEGAGVRGIAIFDHPSNLRHPTCWHVRAYGLMAANCFGLSAFTNGSANGDYTLKNGDSLTFRYRVFVHSGDAEQARVADRYADYVSPPKVTWRSP